MGTNYISWKLQPKEAKKKKETKFIKHVSHDCVCGAFKIPVNYENVIFIGHDKRCGDIFLAFHGDINDINIYFGEKGDEFDD